MNAIFFHNHSACPKWRIEGVASRTNRQTEHSIYVTGAKSWNGDILDADLVIFELVRSPKVVETAKEQGAKVIYEADDALIDTYGTERKNLMQLNDEERENTIKTIQSCDAMTVTNQLLKDNYARFFDGPIYILPNYVDFERYPKDPLKIEKNIDEIRIGWFGSRGHLEDFKLIIPAMKVLMKKYPNLKFVYNGFGGMSSDRRITEIGWGEDVFKELPREQREFYIGVSGDEWPMKLQCMGYDIGIAPLVDDYFNNCKTPIKWMEYSVVEVPSVCSPPLYKEVVDHGKTGFIADSTEEWLEYLTLLIENVKLRKKIGKAAKADVIANHNLDDHWKEWLNVYSEVLNM